MSVKVYYTEFYEAGELYRVEIFQGQLTSSPPTEHFDNAALVLDDKFERGLQGNYLGIHKAASLKCKVDLGLIPTALKKIITTPQVGFTPGAYNPSTCWLLKQWDGAVFHVLFIGTQYQGLESDWKPFAVEKLLDIEVVDIKTDMLSQTTFKDLTLEILNQTAGGWDSEVKLRNVAIDYLVNSTTNASLRSQGLKFTARYYLSTFWMRFYPVKRIFDAIGIIMRNISINSYGLGHLTGFTDYYTVANPLNFWWFFRQEWNENDYAIGTAIDPDDVYTMLFVTQTGVSNPSIDDVADGLLWGKSSLAERFQDKGILEWLNKEWESHLAKAAEVPNISADATLQFGKTDAAPMWYPGAFGEHSTAVTLTFPTIEVSDIQDDAAVKKAEEFITSARCVVGSTNEHFADEYKASAISSSRKESNRDFELTFHNMPSMKRGQRSTLSFPSAAIDFVSAVPIGVLFYEGETANDMLGTEHGVAFGGTSTLMMRVSEYAYCILDSHLANLTTHANGTTKDLIDTTGYDLTDGVQGPGGWDVTATLAQKFCMPMHVSLAMQKIFGNPDRLNFEFTVPLSVYSSLYCGHRANIDIRELIGDPDIFENVTADHIYITDLEANLEKNTLKVKAISEGYYG